MTAQIAEALGLAAPPGALVSDVDRRRAGRQGRAEAGRRRARHERRADRACRGARLPAGDAGIGSDGRASTCWPGRAQDGRASRRRARRSRRSASATSSIGGRSPFAGAKVADLSPRLAQRLGLAQRDQGRRDRRHRAATRRPPASASAAATSCARCNGEEIDSAETARSRSPRRIRAAGASPSSATAGCSDQVLALADGQPLRGGRARGEPQPARPLADRLRPTTLAEVVGQEHLTGAGRRADAHAPLRLARLDDLLGAARHRQDDGRAAARRRDRSRTSSRFRRSSPASPT